MFRFTLLTRQAARKTLKGKKLNIKPATKNPAAPKRTIRAPAAKAPSPINPFHSASTVVPIKPPTAARLSEQRARSVAAKIIKKPSNASAASKVKHAAAMVSKDKAMKPAAMVSKGKAMKPVSARKLTGKLSK